MAFVGGDFDAGDDEKIIDRQAVLAHQTFLEEIGDRIAGVVIGDGEAVQAFLARGCNIVLGTRDAVAGKERVRVQVDLERHCREASLRGAKWKASV